MKSKTFMLDLTCVFQVILHEEKNWIHAFAGMTNMNYYTDLPYGFLSCHCR